MTDSMTKANEKRVAGLLEYEKCIENYKKCMEKLRNSRHQLFHDFELHLADWKSFVDSNMQAMKTQYQQVILSNIDLWGRQNFHEGKRPEAEALVRNIANNINLLSNFCQSQQNSIILNFHRKFPVI